MAKHENQKNASPLVQRVDGKWVTLTEPSEEFSQTWPSSGMMRGGVVYELPKWEQPMDDSESLSLLGTPRVTMNPSKTGVARGELKGRLEAQIAHLDLEK